MPELADKLLKDFRWFPLWSCVYLKRFGYGKIPASSAGVECEFKNIKTKFLNDEVQTLRVDDFVQRFVTKYLSGRSNLHISKEVKIAVENNKENKCEITRSKHGKKKSKSDECSLCSAPCYEKHCPSCNKIDSAPAILASREIENWKGLPLIDVEKEQRVLKEINRNPKKESGYFDKNQETFDSLNFENLKKIPTMLNDNHISQKAINFKGKSYSFANTCPFDSLLQIFLVAAADNPMAKNILMRLQTTELACRKTECNGIVNRKFTASGPFAILEIDLNQKAAYN